MLYSVIVPIYNREKTLKKCIDSILNQTEKDFELILVDDGSVDNSGKICDDYKKQDNRVVVIHKTNGGVSSARNAGIDIAQGKYIVFVDSDDYVGETYLKTFNNLDADLVISGATFKKSQTKIELNDETIELNDKGIIRFLSSSYSLAPWAKRFSKAIIQDHRLRFHTELSYGEDTIFCAEYIKVCKSLSFREVFTYYYCDTYTNSLSKIKGEDFIKQYNIVQEKIYTIFKDKPEVQEYLISKYLWYAENKFNEISQAEINYSQKKKIADTLLRTKYFKLCLKNYKKAGYSISFINMICYKFGLSNIILYKMKKYNEKREK